VLQSTGINYAAPKKTYTGDKVNYLFQKQQNLIFQDQFFNTYLE